MQFTAGQAIAKLEQSHRVPVATKMIKGDVEYNNSLHRRLAMHVAYKATQACDLSERHGTGLITANELALLLRSSVCRTFGVCAWLVWGWKIKRWAVAIRNEFDSDQR